MKAKTERAAGVELLRREFAGVTIEPPTEGETRTVDLCFATESPVRRRMGGEEVDEVLSITAEAVNLERLNAGGPLLLEHEKQIGGVLKAWVDGDGKARARVKFSRSRIASDVLGDVVDGIAKCVSVGYVVDEWKRTVDAAGAVIMRAVRWTAHEVSIVAMPADIGAGVGRAIDFVGVEEIKTEKPETKQMSIEVIKEQRSDAQDIAKLGTKHNMAADAAEFIGRGESLDAFKNHVIERQAVKPGRVFTKEGAGDGMAADYSLGALIRALADGRTLPELEATEHERLSRTAGRGVAGFWVPSEVFKRTVTAASSPAYIGTTVGENIPALNADSLAVRLGARTISGLSGKVTFPQGSKSTAAFLAETATAAESTPDAAALTLDAKRLCAVVQVSKRLLAQGGPDVEAIVRQDIVLQLSLALDRAIFNGAGGVAPTGILTTAGVAAVAGGATRAGAVNLEAAVAGADALGASMAYVMTPAISASLKSEQLGTSGRFALEGRDLLGYAAHASTQVPAGQLIFGNWSEVIIAQFGGGVEVTVDAASAASSGIVKIIANQYVDAGLRHAGSFAVLA